MKPVSIDQIADACAGRVVAPRAPSSRSDVLVTRISSLDDADTETLSFVRSASFIDRWQASHAGAALVTEDTAVAIDAMRTEGTDPGDRPLIVVADTDLAIASIVPLFGDALASQGDHPEPGVHPQATVHPGATIDPSASIGPGCRIGAGATIGAGAVLMANIVLGAHASVGAHTTLHPGVVLGDRCSIGDHGLVFANAVIGADGFNFRPAPDGSGLIKIPHIAAVRIGHHVEIGALAAIDRGKFEDTIIGDGTKIDNLVQIGHNCRVGRCCMICGRVGLSGSVTLGDGVVLAGGVGIADNLTIGKGAIVGAGAGVMNDIPPGETWLGAPAQPVREAMANLNAFRSLSADLRALRKQSKAMAARLDALSPPVTQ